MDINKQTDGFSVERDESGNKQDKGSKICVSCRRLPKRAYFAAEMLSELKIQSKRWFWLFVLTLILLVGTNMAWLYVFQSYDYVTVDSEQGNASYIGNDGDVNNYGNGESKTEKER